VLHRLRSLDVFEAVSAVKEAALLTVVHCWTISPASDRSAVPQREETESFHLIFGRPYVSRGYTQRPQLRPALLYRALTGRRGSQRATMCRSLSECIGARASW